MRAKYLFLGIFTVLTFIYCISACNNSSEPKENDLATREDTIARGKYLVTSIGCSDCHSPKVMTPQGPIPDTSRDLSGHPANMELGKIDKEQLKDWVYFNPTFTAIVGPWGVSYAANITSDETGIGNWSEKQFLTAIRKGKYKGMENGRDLLPPMPWPVYRNFSDDDLKAIFAYLKTTKPINNVVPSPKSFDDL